MSNVRSGRLEDLAFIRNIFNEVIASVDGAIYREEPMSQEEIEMWWAKKKASEVPVFVAENNGQVVGGSENSHHDSRY